MALPAALDRSRDGRFLEIRVEVIVEMHTVDVVPVDDFFDRVEHGTARHRNAGVDPRRLPVMTHPLGMRARHVSGDRLPEIVGRHRAERIEPDMQLESARMCLVDGQGKRVISVVRA